MAGSNQPPPRAVAGYTLQHRTKARTRHNGVVSTVVVLAFRDYGVANPLPAITIFKQN